MMGTEFHGLKREQIVQNSNTLWQAKGKLDSDALAFYEHVTVPLQENVSIFAPLYATFGRESVNPATISAALLYKAAFNIRSEEEMAEKMLTSDEVQIALGLYNQESKPFTVRQFARFRDRVKAYERKTGINLVQVAMEKLVEKYSGEMDLGGALQRMDSTLCGANIEVNSRIGLLYSGLSKVVRQIMKIDFEGFIDWENFNKTFEDFTDRSHRNRFLYHSEKNGETGWHGMDKGDYLCQKFDELVAMNEECFYIFTLSPAYEDVVVLFDQQTMIDKETGKRRLKTTDDHAMSSGMMQSIHDKDATYKKKNGKENWGYVVNFNEYVGLSGSMVTSWALKPNNVGDTTMLKEHLASLPDAPAGLDVAKMQKLILDGAYYSYELSVLAKKKGILLLPTDLTGVEVNPFLAGFVIRDGVLSECPAGCKCLPEFAKPLNMNNAYYARMNLEDCKVCPHYKDQCPVHGKYVATLTLYEKSIERARIQAALGTDIYKLVGRLRNGVETIPSLMKNTYHLAKLKFRNILDNLTHVSICMGAIGFKKFLGFLRGTGRYAENELINNPSMVVLA